MKLTELKNRFHKKYVIRVIAGVLIVSLVGAGISVSSVQAAKGKETQTTTEVSETSESEATGADAETTDAENALKDALNSSITINDREIGKEETVYVIADSLGTAKKVIVSDHLFNPEHQNTIKDVSTLQNIENVKGDETFTQNGTDLTWQADGNDIYYQGTTETDTPITQKITYYLDGKEIKPEDLAGKSGKVTIHFDYTNHEKVQTTINGKESEVYVPFIALSGMLLDDSFSNIEVTNGKVIADGNKNLIIGYTLPGLKESLDVDDSDFDGDISIPDSFEVTADVTNFSLGMTMTVVANATNLISAEGDTDSSAVNDLLDTLTDATSQLQDGSSDLADGLDTLQTNLVDFQTGMNTLADGAAALETGAGTLADGISTLNTSAKSISDGIATLDNTLKTPMTDAEKATYSAQAVASVDASFTPGSDTYNYIYQAAAQSFSATMNGSADSIYLGLRYQAGGTDSTLYTSLYQAGYASTLESKFQENLPALCQQTFGVNDPTTLTVAQYQALKTGFESQVGATISAAVQQAVEENLKTLASGVASGIATQGADATAASVVDACRSASEQAATSALLTGIETTKSTIAASIEATQSSGYSLVSGAAALSAGTQTLADKVPDLLTGVKALNTGASQLNDGTGAIVDGVDQLTDGAHQLADGMITFNEEGIDQILNSYNGDIEPLIERIQAVLDAGTDYQTYTDIADGTNGSVKFIYKTDAI